MNLPFSRFSNSQLHWLDSATFVENYLVDISDQSELPTFVEELSRLLGFKENFLLCPPLIKR